MGIAVLAAMAILLVFSPTTWFVTLKIKKLMEDMMVLKDKRVKVTIILFTKHHLLKYSYGQNSR